MKKYICFGQHMWDRDADKITFVGAGRVAELYQVPREECVLINNDRDLKWVDRDGLIEL